jgi:hypothetical protein
MKEAHLTTILYPTVCQIGPKLKLMHVWKYYLRIPSQNWLLSILKRWNIQGLQSKNNKIFVASSSAKKTKE